VASLSVSPAQLASALGAVRETNPLVQCLTNIVVAQWTANSLLSLGAAPAMVDNVQEAALFATFASGVLINTGTPYAETAEAMSLAAASAVKSGTPWVLDPVAAGGLPWRTEIARQLLGNSAPQIIRGNGSEILGLAGGAGGKGVDSTDPAEAALAAANAIALEYNTVVAISGEVDHITDGTRLVRISNGHPLMTQVTGVGCALGSIMAAFAGVEKDYLVAASAATATLTVAGDIAAEGNPAPGTFAVRLLDALNTITPAQLAERVVLS